MLQIRLFRVNIFIVLFCTLHVGAALAKPTARPPRKTCTKLVVLPLWVLPNDGVVAPDGNYVQITKFENGHRAGSIIVTANTVAQQFPDRKNGLTYTLSARDLEDAFQLPSKTGKLKGKTYRVDSDPIFQIADRVRRYYEPKMIGFTKTHVVFGIWELPDHSVDPNKIWKVFCLPKSSITIVEEY